MKPKAMTFEEWYCRPDPLHAKELTENLQAMFDGILAAESIPSPPQARQALFHACKLLVLGAWEEMEKMKLPISQYAVLLADPYDRGGKEVLSRIEEESGDALLQIQNWFLNRPVCLACQKAPLALAMRPPISFNPRQRMDQGPGQLLTVTIAYGGNAYIATPLGNMAMPSRGSFGIGKTEL